MYDPETNQPLTGIFNYGAFNELLYSPVVLLYVQIVSALLVGIADSGAWSLGCLPDLISSDIYSCYRVSIIFYGLSQALGLGTAAAGVV